MSFNRSFTVLVAAALAAVVLAIVLVTLNIALAAPTTPIAVRAVTVQNPVVSAPPDNLDPGSLRRLELIKLNDGDNVDQAGGLRRYPSLVQDEPGGTRKHSTGILRK